MARDSETHGEALGRVASESWRKLEAAQRTARGLETMAQVETLTRQLREAREALKIAQTLTMRSRVVQPVQRLIDIRQACAIGLHRSSDDFKGG